MADASIFAQYLKPVKSVAEYQQEGDERTLSRLKLLLGQQEVEQKQRGFADDNAVKGIMRGATSREEAAKALFQAGYVNQGGALEDQMQKLLKSKADIGKDEAETAAKNWGVKKDKLDRIGQGMGWLMQNPSAENAQSMFQSHVQNGLMTPEEATQYMGSIQSNPTPENVKSLAQQGFQSILAAKDQLPKTQTTNAGGKQLYQSVNPVTGQVTQTGSDAITQSSDNAATQATSRANNAASVGAQYANAAATREVAKSNVTAAGLRRDQDTEMKLADDYRKQSKDFGDSTSAYKQISSALGSANTSAAATLAAATKFMKILDPGSVVRESELAMALAATGVFDRVGNYMNTLQNGKTLTKSQVDDFKNISAKLYDAAKQVQQGIDKDYTAKANTYKLRPEMVVQDLGQNATSPNMDMSAIDAEIARRRRGK